MNSPTVRRLILFQSAFRSAKQEGSESEVTKGRLNVSLYVYWGKSTTCLLVQLLTHLTCLSVSQDYYLTCLFVQRSKNLFAN